MTKLRTHYDNLKVARDAPDFVIRAAYKTLSQRYHPDKHPGDERAGRVMALINSSYEVLSDPERRAAHDAWIAREEAKLARERAQKPQGGVSIPPQWQKNPSQQEQPPAPQPQEHNGNTLLSVLLWPLKIPLRILADAAPLLPVVLLLGGGLWLWDSIVPDRLPPAGPKPYQANAPARPESSRTSKPAREANRYVRPVAAPNGSPWPTRAAYIKGYPVDHDDGYSKVTVDNSQNDSDVFVKLVSLESANAYPVRQFFVPARSRFTLDDVSAGRYDIRYRDLESGGLSRSEAIDVEEIDDGDSVQFSNITLTLYKVQGGNFQTYDLADSEF